MSNDERTNGNAEALSFWADKPVSELDGLRARQQARHDEIMAQRKAFYEHYEAIRDAAYKQAAEARAEIERNEAEIERNEEARLLDRRVREWRKQGNGLQ
jgi:hypothetical protein